MSLMKANGLMPALCILGRKFTADALILPKVFAAHRWSLMRDGVFKQALRNDLVRLLLLGNTRVEHLS